MLKNSTVENVKSIVHIVDEKEWSRLEGKLLTLIDATMPANQQNAAIKSVARETLWDFFNSLAFYDQQNVAKVIV
jgi:hypothetical protein